MARETAKMVIQSCITLASAALGLVAALAWNDAIKALIKEVWGENEGLGALFTYAIIATLLAVVVILVLARMAAKIGGEAAISREAEG
ncbi:MAG TPA: DUF5654 family protein [Pyrinomonadaceae bacterium]